MEAGWKEKPGGIKGVEGRGVARDPEVCGKKLSNDQLSLIRMDKDPRGVLVLMDNGEVEEEQSQDGAGNSRSHRAGGGEAQGRAKETHGASSGGKAEGLDHTCGADGSRGLDVTSRGHGTRD